VSGAFIIEPLGQHDRSAFSCGKNPLDRYIREQASQDVKRFVASCFVAIETATQSLAGYYTLAATSVAANDIPPDILKRLPRYPLLPAALIGRLAVDLRFHRQGLGAALLVDAALRVIKGDVKAFALVVEAKDEEAFGFYRKHEFLPFTNRAGSLFLPLATLKQAASHSG